jgi:hypothetical protein
MAPAQKGWLQYIPALGMALSFLSIVAIDGADGHSERVPGPRYGIAAFMARRSIGARLRL